MKIKNLLVAINAKFSHSSLAIRYLRNELINELTDEEPILKEYTINNPYLHILQDILAEKPQIIGFSVYIWNAEIVFRLIKDIRAFDNEILIVLGGPEVSYDIKEILKQNESIDLIIYNEGELTYKELMSHVYSFYSGSLESDRHRLVDSIKSLKILGIAGNSYEGIFEFSPRPLIENLDVIPFPYNDFDDFKNKKIYYESSRGCPFNCSYCLSSTTGKLRFFSLDRVKSDLKIFLDNNLVQVKFIDRTFNADRSRTLEIFKYICENDNGVTNFHFEIVAELLDFETIDYINKNARKGLFQFEIGVQSTNGKTICAINRNLKFDNLIDKVKSIQDSGNIHLHLDLIAGLPFEDYYSFLNSLNDLLILSPNQIQLGFLKLLRGSQIRIDSAEYAYSFMLTPPYEVYFNKFINFDQMIKLKAIEEVVELYYNSHIYDFCLGRFIEKYYNKPVDMYIELAEFFKSMRYLGVNMSASKRYEVLYEFIESKILDKNDLEYFYSCLKHDYYMNNKRVSNCIFSDLNYLKRFTDDFANFNVKGYYRLLKNRLETKSIIKNVSLTPFTMDIFSQDQKSWNQKVVVAYLYDDKQNSMNYFLLSYNNNEDM